MKIYDQEINDANEIMEMMAAHLSGTCMTHIDATMENDEFSKAVKEFGVTEEMFEKYLLDEGIFECDTCGWWTYAGEGNGVDCDDCIKEEDEDDD